MSQNPQNPAPTPTMEMPEGLEPVYSNIVRIIHSNSEIVIDFSRLLPAEPRFKVLARILMSPAGAKLLYRALGDNITRYEAVFGEIKLPKTNTLADDLFRQVQPPKSPESE